MLIEAAELLAAKHLKTPLEILTDIAQNSDDEDTQVRAAQAAAPYVHKRMPQDINMSGELKVHSTFANAVKEK